MKNLFLVTLKNPPVTHLIDDYPNSIKDDEVVKFTQEGLLLVIPLNQDYNIAYIKEITQEEAENIKKRIAERTSEKKIIKPEFKIPTKRGRDS